MVRYEYLESEVNLNWNKTLILGLVYSDDIYTINQYVEIWTKTFAKNDQKYPINIGLKAVNLAQRSNHLKNIKFKFILWITVAELVTIWEQ